MPKVANDTIMPFFFVEGENWDVKIDYQEIYGEDIEFDNEGKISRYSLDGDDILIDVASRALEVFKSFYVNFFIDKNGEKKPSRYYPEKAKIYKLNFKGESPKLGAFLKVTFIDGEENSCQLIPTSICLANNGYYEEAFVMENSAKKAIAAQKRKRKKK